MKSGGLRHPQRGHERAAVTAQVPIPVPVLVHRAVVAGRVWMASALVLGGAVAIAAGPVGPVGPVGPLGPSRSASAVESPGADLHRTPRPPLGAPSAAPGAYHGAPAGAATSTGNHIEVTGNTAAGTHCSQNGTASVNSIDVSRARLNGQTVIVQGRNTQSVDTRDCPPHTDGVAGGHKTPEPPAQVNSIRIR